jgi:hypothetical protein
MAAGFGRRTTAAVIVLAIAVLSGCSESDKPAETLPSGSSAAITSSEALPPLGPPNFPVPDEARERTSEGALAFMRYYIGLSSHIADGSVEPQALLDLSDGCGTCARVAASYQQDRAAGLTYEGFEYTFREYGLPVITGSQAEIGFVYSQGPYEVIDKSGIALPGRRVQASGDLQSGAFLVWRDDLASWMVTSMTIG